MLDLNSVVLHWDTLEYEQARTSTLKSLWENENFVDVTLVCDDGLVKAHQIILSSVSPFFHKILQKIS